MRESNRIALVAVPALVVSTVVGAGVLVLPSDLAQAVGPDSWIGIILGTIIALIGALLIILLAMQFPKESIAEYSPKLLGKFLGWLFNWALASLFVVTTTLVLRIFADTVNVVLLRRTPLEVTMVYMLIACALIASKGLVPLSRVCQIAFYVYLVPLLLIPIIIPEIDLQAFRPVLAEGTSSLIDGSLATIFSFIGFEIFLVITPEIKQQRKLYRSVAYGLGIVGLIYMFVAIVPIGVLTASQTAQLQYPFVEALKFLPVPVLLVERIELVIFTVWIFAAYTTISLFLYISSKHLASTLRTKNFKLFIVPIGIAVIVLARIPQNIAEVEHYVEYINYSWLILVFILTPVLAFLGYIRRKSRN